MPASSPPGAQLAEGQVQEQMDQDLWRPRMEVQDRSGRRDHAVHHRVWYVIAIEPRLARRTDGRQESSKSSICQPRPLSSRCASDHHTPISNSKEASRSSTNSMRRVARWFSGCSRRRLAGPTRGPGCILFYRCQTAHVFKHPGLSGPRRILGDNSRTSGSSRCLGAAEPIDCTLTRREHRMKGPCCSRRLAMGYTSGTLSIPPGNRSSGATLAISV